MSTTDPFPAVLPRWNRHDSEEPMSPLHWVVAVQTAIATMLRRSDRGQATAEYALVILGAAAVALLVIAWATSTGKVGDLLDKVVDSVASRVA